MLGLKNLYVLSDSNDPLTIEAVLVDGLYGQVRNHFCVPIRDLVNTKNPDDIGFQMSTSFSKPPFRIMRSVLPKLRNLSETLSQCHRRVKVKSPWPSAETVPM